MEIMFRFWFVGLRETLKNEELCEREREAFLWISSRQSSDFGREDPQFCCEIGVVRNRVCWYFFAFAQESAAAASIGAFSSPSSSSPAVAVAGEVADLPVQRNSTHDDEFRRRWRHYLQFQRMGTLMSGSLKARSLSWSSSSRHKIHRFNKNKKEQDVQRCWESIL